jgi:hypothetical protein
MQSHTAANSNKGIVGRQLYTVTILNGVFIHSILINLIYVTFIDNKNLPLF